MNLICALRGHSMPSGYQGSPPYLRAEDGHSDGIGREHWRLIARCARCDAEYHVASVHGPLSKALLRELGEDA